jgi:hypothetical protein
MPIKKSLSFKKDRDSFVGWAVLRLRLATAHPTTDINVILDS